MFSRVGGSAASVVACGATARLRCMALSRCAQSPVCGAVPPASAPHPPPQHSRHSPLAAGQMNDAIVSATIDKS